MSNKSEGNLLERAVCIYLKSRGWWCHNFTQNASGQPMDIIAVKNGRAYLIDCKNCTGKYFETSRIEDNQRLAIKAFKKAGNNEGFFLLANPHNVHRWYLFTLATLDEYKRLSMDEIERVGIPIERWCEVCENDNWK